MPYFKFEDHKVHYNIHGEGAPLLLLPGNTVSSRLFDSVKKIYAQNFQVILIDFPGHGKSSRVNKFETDFWYYNAKVCKALLDHLKIEKVLLVGTSGGALIGINLALECPERIEKLFADSFEGEIPLPSFVENLREDRANDKKKFLAKIFWFVNHGWDWKKVVDQDTDMMLSFVETGRSFFHKPISELSVPTLLTGSRKDEYCDHIEDIYLKLQAKNPALKIHMFDDGGHPAMLSNKEKFLKLVTIKSD